MRFMFQKIKPFTLEKTGIDILESQVIFWNPYLLSLKSFRRRISALSQGNSVPFADFMFRLLGKSNQKLWKTDIDEAGTNINSIVFVWYHASLSCVS